MALINVIKHEMKDGEFCGKFPSDDLRIGSQLVVYPSQTAIFVKGGSICDTFTSGTYTISTNNIPILGKIVNLPFGKETPFKAEVWFVNHIAKLDLPWGTPQPIQIEDPKYKVIVPVRANGQYGLKVKDATSFLESLIGNMTSFTTEQINAYYKGKIISALNSIIAQQIIEKGVSVLDINTKLMELSSVCETLLNDILEKYGVSIIEFSIMNISIPEDDPSVVKLKKTKDLVARLNIAGRDVYQMERSFDVLEKAAANEGAGGQFAAMGAGLGAGVGIGNAVGSAMGNYMNTNPVVPPPLQTEVTYYLHLNGTAVGGQTISQIKSLVQQGIVNADTMAWTAGMQQWARISDIAELSDIVNSQTPPPLN